MLLAASGKSESAATIIFRETMWAGGSQILIGVSAHYQNHPPPGKEKIANDYQLQF